MSHRITRRSWLLAHPIKRMGADQFFALDHHAEEANQGVAVGKDRFYDAAFCADRIRARASAEQRRSTGATFCPVPIIAGLPRITAKAESGLPNGVPIPNCCICPKRCCRY